MKKIKKSILRSISLILIVIFICSILAGCNSSPVNENINIESNEEQNIIITDLSGRVHRFSKPLKKVAIQWSCAGGPFMTMSAILGDEIADHIACMDDSPEKYRADVWEQCIKDVPKLKDIPVIGSVDKELNLEGLLASGAEALICPLELKTLIDGYTEDILKKADIPVIYVDFHKESIDNHVKSTLLLGKLFGKEERAKEIVDFYTSHKENITKRIEEIMINEERPEMYIEVGMGGPSDFGNSFDNHYSWGAIAYQSGATSIGENVVFNYGPLNNEYIISKDPKKIVFTGSYGASVPNAIRLGYGVTREETLESMHSFFKRYGWSELSAFKSGEVYAINHGMAREMYDCACFEFFAKICYPNHFEDIDPQKTLESYFETFMPYELSGTWFIY